MLRPVLSKNGIALAGEFAVLSQLLLRGFDANMTLGNTKAVDILAVYPGSRRVFKLQVKTALRNSQARSQRYLSWVMSDKNEHDVDLDLFYCLVSIDRSTYQYRFFILHSSTVALYLKHSHEHFLLDPRHVDNLVRQFRLALEDTDYPIHTPLAKEHENLWGFPLPTDQGLAPNS